MKESLESFQDTGSFVDRHIGPRPEEINEMLRTLEYSSLDELIKATVPARILTKRPLTFEATGGAAGKKHREETEVLAELKTLVSHNQTFRSYIGMGYNDTITPPVILRNILENPGWYTQYTPYQAEISQGRLEALLNFQTMVTEMTGLEIANASMLDEATAAAEAMNMAFNVKNRDASRAFFVSDACNPQTIALLKTRSEPMGIKLIIGNHEKFQFDQPIYGALVQYPNVNGDVIDYRKFFERVHAADALTVISADILSLAVLTSPGELGADIAVGTTQRFGIPMGFGGPSAGYMATRDAYKRHMPGRIVGVSKDTSGRPAIRLALQTREQHIRREKATSNICTAQVLLAIMSSMYAIYHGPKGLRRIAEKVHYHTTLLGKGLKKLGYELSSATTFDTLTVSAAKDRVKEVHNAAKARRINLRAVSETSVGVSLDETVTLKDIEELLQVFACGRGVGFSINELASNTRMGVDPAFARKKEYLKHAVFNTHHSETEMLRYMTRLQAKDLSLANAMIPLGSCTMKLNATAEMIPITWPEFSKPHPYAPLDQVKGTLMMIQKLEAMLAEITGFKAVSVQPNAGAQGEYAGLLVIRKYLQSRGQASRNICLIPKSAHGTNPASAAMAGMQIVVVDCDSDGNIDINDLRTKAEQHRADLAALMVTYPSTHGVFEEAITEICDIVHKNGGQVYMDGANMNAQVGLCSPREIGADVCHLNLHKTFAMPHGGGGPGVGPICVAEHLAQFLPSHPVVTSVGGKSGIGPVSASPWGSAGILPIAYVYIALMGGDGLKRATEAAILNANYIAKRLDPHYPVLYKGKNGRVAHECIVDLRPIKAATGIDVEDVAKRLMDYGFHAPTISFPVAGTMMIEPTESEPKFEIDRFCEAMIAIRQEIAEVEQGKADRNNNVVKNAPHTAEQVVSDNWNKPYSRERAAFPTAFNREYKFWPASGRIDNVYGDRNLVTCLCVN